MKPFGCPASCALPPLRKPREKLGGTKLIFPAIDKLLFGQIVQAALMGS
ncbi:hypothetical protein [Paenibacillus sp. FSL H7-0331]|nr:hypothetical protein [Paenibacillus sp. FSL H7-0331]